MYVPVSHVSEKLTSSGSISGIATAKQVASEFVAGLHGGISVNNEFAD